MVPWGGGTYVVAVCGPSSTGDCESDVHSAVLAETAVIQPSALNCGKKTNLCVHECSLAYCNRSTVGSPHPSCNQSYKNMPLTILRCLLEHLLKAPCPCLPVASYAAVFSRQSLGIFWKLSRVRMTTKHECTLGANTGFLAMVPKESVW